MTDREPALALALEARRVGVLVVLGEMRAGVTIARLDALLHGRYGQDLAALTVEELLGPTPRRSLLLDRGESIEDAVMRVFKRQRGGRLTSGFFIRHMGLARWTAQALLAELAARGWLVREGRTSGTSYRLAAGDELELDDSDRGATRGAN